MSTSNGNKCLFLLPLEVDVLDSGAVLASPAEHAKRLDWVYLPDKLIRFGSLNEDSSVACLIIITVLPLSFPIQWGALLSGWRREGKRCVGHCPETGGVH